MAGTAEGMIPRIARRYYLEGQSKSDIARQFGISRFQVARLLEQGLEEGIITIEIKGDQGPLDQLSIDLSRHLGLHACVVVPGSGSQWQVRNRIARATASMIRTTLNPGDTFGFSWGRTMLAVSEHLSNLPPSAVLQLTGTVGEDLTASPLEILRSISGLSSVTAHPIFAPLFVGSAASAEVLRADPAIASTISKFPSLRLAVMSVGSWRPPITQLREFLSPEDVAMLDDGAAQAEILGIFLDADGRIIASGLDARRIAATPTDLLSTPHVIAAAGSLEKVPAIMAATRSGLITTLVTDDQAAHALLAMPAVKAKALTRP